MVNCTGDMVAGFSGSGLTNYISAFYTWQLNGGSMLDRPRAFQSATVKFAGTRWGDYSATRLDPNDDWSFWTVQQYAAQVQGPGGSVNKWATAIARIKAGP